LELFPTGQFVELMGAKIFRINAEMEPGTKEKQRWWSAIG
jgi:hypothetical protein